MVGMRTYKIRQYKIKRHALTNQIVTICNSSITYLNFLFCMEGSGVMWFAMAMLAVNGIMIVIINQSSACSALKEPRVMRRRILQVHQYRN